ncbi:hypothetical protein ACFYW1_04285 [Streptomyces sp. NPDC002669]|uniref:hypothetical protein n=1 Tax=Streptomyces sp. NPDC002669 TaxID=3364658 RepID=UPI0036C1DAB7
MASARSSLTLTPAQRVVVAQRYGDAARADSKAQGYRLSGDEANTVDVQLYNLNDVAVTGTLHAEADNGWRTANTQPQVTIPAMSSVTVPVKVSAGPGTVMGIRGELRVSADFGGQKTSPSVAEITGSSVAGTAGHVLSADGKHAVRVVYTNITDKPTRLAAVKVRFGKEKVTAPTRGAMVWPGRSLPVDVPIPGTAKDGTDYRVQFVTSGDAAHQLAGTVGVPAADVIAEAGPRRRSTGHHRPRASERTPGCRPT